MQQYINNILKTEGNSIKKKIFWSKQGSNEKFNCFVFVYNIVFWGDYIYITIFYK